MSSRASKKSAARGETIPKTALSWLEMTTRPPKAKPAAKARRAAPLNRGQRRAMWRWDVKSMRLHRSTLPKDKRPMRQDKAPFGRDGVLDQKGRRWVVKASGPNRHDRRLRNVIDRRTAKKEEP